MKKLLVLLALSHSFVGNAQVSLGPEVGLNINSISGASTTYTLRTGGRLGFSADFKIADKLYLQPGLFYSSKGGHSQDESNQSLLGGLNGFGGILDSLGIGNLGSAANLGAKENVTYAINYLQLPVLAIYKFEGKEGDIFAGLGPYIAWAMDGKYSRTLVSSLAGQSITSNESRAIETGTEVNSIDFGLNVNLGYLHSSGFFCRAFYEMGLIDNYLGKNMSFGLTMGYLFNSKHQDN